MKTKLLRALIVIAIVLVASLLVASYVFSQSSNIPNYIEILHLGRGRAIALDWRPGYNTLAVGATDGSVWLYTANFDDVLPLPNNHDETSIVAGIKWSRDGSKLAIDRRFKSNGVIEIWDIDSLTMNVLIPSHLNEDVRDVLDWNSDGSRIAIINDDEFRIEIWDVITGQLTFQWQPTGLPIRGVAWSSDGSKIAISDRDDMVRIWDASSATLLNTLEGGQSLTAVVWSPNSSMVAGYLGADVLVWDITNTQPIATLQGPSSDYIFRLAWSTEGLASSAGNETRVWDVATGEIIASLESGGYLTWNATGTRLATTGGFVGIWNTTSESLMSRSYMYSPDATDFVWSPNGDYIASIHRDSVIRIWNTSNGRFFTSLEGHTGGVTDLDWSPDGTRIASTQNNIETKIWDAMTGQQLESFAEYGGTIAWNPNGSQIAVSWQGDTTILNVNTGTVVTNFSAYINSSPWRIDGSQIVGITFDADDIPMMATWDSSTGEQIAIFDNQIIPSIVTWSPLGEYIASGSTTGKVLIWDANTNNLINEIQGDIQRTDSISWNPDTTIIAIAGNSGNIRFWDFITAQQINTIETNEIEIKKAIWNTDGNYIASLGLDGIIRIWGT